MAIFRDPAEISTRTLFFATSSRTKQSLPTILKRFPSSAPLGGIVLGMNAKGNRLQHWSDMIKSPGQAHAKIHYLSANYID